MMESSKRIFRLLKKIVICDNITWIKTKGERYG